MTIRKWWRKLAISLVAGGLLAPAAARAADLNVNLVTNPGFEVVNNASSQGGYNAVEILQWNDGTRIGFAYSHDGSLNSMGATIPDYANGGPLAGGGSFYFTSNASEPEIFFPGEVSQLIDISTGPTAAAIAGGSARFELSAFFSSYLNDGDFGNVSVEFLDGSLAPIQVPTILFSTDTTTWNNVGTSGLISPGAAVARISVFGTALSGGPDGYIDNVDFRVIPEPATVVLAGMGLVAAGVLLLRRRGGT